MNSSDVGLNDLICRAPKVAQRMFEERMLVITVQDSRLHRFNESGTFIWQMLERPCSVEEISKSVARHFDGCSMRQAQDDTKRFIRMLVGKGLIVCKKKENER